MEELQVTMAKLKKIEKWSFCSTWFDLRVDREVVDQ
jgi:hypothetical protein